MKGSGLFSNVFGMVNTSQSINSSGPTPQKLHILLIEDNPFDQQLFFEHLSDTSFAQSEVTTAEAIMEAQMILQKQPVDLVVADMNLMDASSMETINLLNRSFSHIPIVLLTGQMDLEMARQAIRSGIQSYLVKDVQTSQTLNLSILQALEHFQLKESMNFTIKNLYQKSQLQNRITRSMSHDFRSPINNILSLLDLMEKDPDNTELYREKAVTAGQHMLSYLEENLEMLRSPSGVEGKPELINLDVCLQEVLDEMKHQLSSVDIFPDFLQVGEIRYSPLYLKGYFLNLISNAIKYRHPNRKPVIHVRSKQLEGFVAISVSDNGLGIDLKKYGKQVFGFKKRFHDTAAAGTGLGLFNLKNQIESLNGKIEVESVPGEGSTFTMYLPEF